MRTELVNFVNSLSPEVFSYNLELDEGLYIFVDLDDDGNLLSFEKGVHKKRERKEKPETELEEQYDLTPDFWQKCLAIQINAQPVSPAKIFNPIKKIFGASCSGFALCFNKKNLYTDKMFRKEEVEISLKEYFKGAEKYIKPDYENHVLWFGKFKSFCTTNLINFLLETPEYVEAKELFKVNIFLKDPEVIDYQLIYEPYMANSVFNKDEYKLEIEEIVYNVADSLSSFNASKAFLKHKTAPFEFNYRISGEEAKAIWQFFNIRGRLLPNPLPIFIEYNELNNEVVKIINEDKKISYKEILEKIFDSPQHRGDLGNYYLLFFLKGEIIDLDFVPSFQYGTNDMAIEEVFPLGGKQQKIIKNIFEFEREVANRMLNGQLISGTKDGGLWLKYFGDVKFKPKYMTHNTYNQLLKYRKAFYDYVYKSKRESIQSFMFHDIMSKGILDDIIADEYKEKNHTKEFSIKEKINIWFSLYYYFDNPKNNNSMVLANQNLLEKIRKISRDDNERIQHDNEFAFAVGQLVRHLLKQSEVGERTHALLEPFLQKSEVGQLKLAIARAFDTYKHAITFYKGDTRYEFDRMMDNVMNFPPSTTNMKELLPYILGGYFSETVFKKQQ